jgi:hypothetical protein
MVALVEKSRTMRGIISEMMEGDIKYLSASIRKYTHILSGVMGLFLLTQH